MRAHRVCICEVRMSSSSPEVIHRENWRESWWASWWARQSARRGARPPRLIVVRNETAAPICIRADERSLDPRTGDRLVLAPFEYLSLTKSMWRAWERPLRAMNVAG